MVITNNFNEFYYDHNVKIKPYQLKHWKWCRLGCPAHRKYPWGAFRRLYSKIVDCSIDFVL